MGGHGDFRKLLNFMVISENNEMNLITRLVSGDVRQKQWVEDY